MKTKNRRDAGFSLLELIISLSLSTIVLIGVIILATQLLRNEAQTLKSGQVSAQTMASLSQMNRELEQATYLAPGLPGTAGSNIISGCINYSSTLGASSSCCASQPCVATTVGYGQIDCSRTVQSFYYCVAAGSGVQGNLDSLLRYPAFGNISAGVSDKCPYNGGTAPACTLADATSHDVVISKNMSHSPAAPLAGFYFKRDDAISGVDVDFVVGYATPVVKGQGTATAGFVGLAQPVAYYVDSKITMQKNFLNSSD